MKNKNLKRIREEIFFFKILFFGFLSAFLFLPAYIANAQFTIAPPCFSAPEGCGLCDFGVLIKNIIDLLAKYIAPSLTVFFVAYGAINLVIFGYSEETRNRAKKTIQAAIIGFIIVMVAWLIIDTIMKILTGGNWGPWNKITC